MPKFEVELPSGTYEVDAPNERDLVRMKYMGTGFLRVSRKVFEVMQQEIGALSQAVFDSDKSAARSHLDRINEAWAYAEPLIVSQFGELADQITYDLRRVVGLARSAVERNRPADASKAVAFFRLASASLNVAG